MTALSDFPHFSNEEALFKALRAQGFRIDPRAEGQQVVNEETGNSVFIHASSIVDRSGSRSKNILKDLVRIGFVPPAEFTKRKREQRAQTAAQAQAEETEVSMAVATEEESPTDSEEEEKDPNDRWVTIAEAAKVLGLGSSGVAQRIRAGKLRTIKMPLEVGGPGGGTRTVQAQHVNLAEALASGGRQRRGPGTQRTGPVRTRFENTSAGRLSQAAQQARSAMSRIEAGFEDLRAALETIDTESTGAMQELHETKQRQKQIEKDVERLVGRL